MRGGRERWAGERQRGFVLHLAFSSVCLRANEDRDWEMRERKRRSQQKQTEKEKKKTKEDFGNIDDLGNVSGVGCFELFALNLKAISHGILMTLELF